VPAVQPALKLALSSPRRAALVCLVLPFAGFACADPDNPVIPSTSALPGGQAAGNGDAAAGGAATGDGAPESRTDTTAPVSCDLLKQDCPLDPISSLPRACYPEGGVGRCETIGDGKPAYAPCSANSDCDRGLACVATCGLSFKECQPICDPNVPLASTDCASDQVCMVFDGSRTAGYCWQPC
jgi:hypothetical protein